MIPDPSFQDLMDRLHGGDEQAAEEIFHRYASRLIALARRRLDSRLNRKVEPEDILQSVFRSFFHRQADGRLAPHDWEHLWALLAKLTVRKCSGRLDHYRAARRDLRREAEGPTSPESSVSGWEALAREPTPEEAATLEDLVEKLLGGFEDHERQIVSLHLQDFSIQEIRTEAGCSERTVYRVLQRARERLTRILARADE
jgi:RNA polymerase sigma factor (sigma-70 family)